MVVAVQVQNVLSMILLTVCRFKNVIFETIINLFIGPMFDTEFHLEMLRDLFGYGEVKDMLKNHEDSTTTVTSVVQGVHANNVIVISGRNR